MSLKPENRAESNQCWRTPPEFLAAVQRRFGHIDFDLAATTGHEVTRHNVIRGPDGKVLAGPHFSPEDDSLAQDWRALTHTRVAWLNPPFANIAPWAKKVTECSGLPRWTLMLVPASMGSKWWANYVLGKTMVFGVPRMKFVGADHLYPKDLALVCSGYGVSGCGYWDWRKS